MSPPFKDSPSILSCLGVTKRVPHTVENKILIFTQDFFLLPVSAGHLMVFLALVPCPPLRPPGVWLGVKGNTFGDVVVPRAHLYI